MDSQRTRIRAAEINHRQPANKNTPVGPPKQLACLKQKPKMTEPLPEEKMDLDDESLSSPSSQNHDPPAAPPSPSTGIHHDAPEFELRNAETPPIGSDTESSTSSSTDSSSDSDDSDADSEPELELEPDDSAD
jgi:hypothetical protein